MKEKQVPIFIAVVLAGAVYTMFSFIDGIFHWWAMIVSMFLGGLLFIVISIDNKRGG